MRRHFTITVHDDKGLKQINLPYSIKSGLLYGAIFLVAVGILTLFGILYLNNTIDNMVQKRTAMQKLIDDEQKITATLMTSIQENELVLQHKNEELKTAIDRLDNIEGMIGLTPHEDVSVEERIELAMLTSEEIALMHQHIPNGSPIEYKGVSSPFGYRTHPITKKRSLHKGTDMIAAKKTPVYVQAEGVVEYVGRTRGFGRLVRISHNYGFKTYYAHLNSFKVKTGDFVKKGDLIALSGNSGVSNGPHLHYEIRFLDRPLNAFNFIKWEVDNYQDIFEKEKKVPWHSLVKTITSNRFQVTKLPLSQKVLALKEN
ncbi:MAG: M23 family metallopeptidase [Campylobacterota bacterium]|nr:M23 family metallopeptidase [Campylobacterota bacterium]